MDDLMHEIWQECWVPAFKAAQVGTPYEGQEPYPFEEIAEKAPILYDFLRRVAERTAS